MASENAAVKQQTDQETGCVQKPAAYLSPSRLLFTKKRFQLELWKAELHVGLTVLVEWNDEQWSGDCSAMVVMTLRGDAYGFTTPGRYVIKVKIPVVINNAGDKTSTRFSFQVMDHLEYEYCFMQFSTDGFFTEDQICMMRTQAIEYVEDTVTLFLRGYTFCKKDTIEL